MTLALGQGTVATATPAAATRRKASPNSPSHRRSTSCSPGRSMSSRMTVAPGARRSRRTASARCARQAEPRLERRRTVDDEEVDVDHRGEDGCLVVPVRAVSVGERLQWRVDHDDGPVDALGAQLLDDPSAPAGIVLHGDEASRVCSSALGQQARQQHGAHAAAELHDAAAIMEDHVVAHLDQTRRPHRTGTPRQVRPRQRAQRERGVDIAEHPPSLARRPGLDLDRTVHVRQPRTHRAWRRRCRCSPSTARQWTPSGAASSKIPYWRAGSLLGVRSTVTSLMMWPLLGPSSRIR